MEGEKMSRDIFKTISATNHSNTEREENDFYATSPSAARFLIDLEDLSSNIWECACGQGHLSKVFAENGYNVKSTDLIDRGYGESGIDFLKQTERFNGDIVTNPPYKYAKEFVEKALSIITDGHKVCMFLKLTFAEGKTRRSLFKNTPPRRVWVSSARIISAKNGEFENITSSAVCYAWFVWEKGYKGTTELKWFN